MITENTFIYLENFCTLIMPLHVIPILFILRLLMKLDYPANRNWERFPYANKVNVYILNYFLNWT